MGTALVYLGAVVALIAGRTQADCYSRNGVASKDSRWYTGAELVSCGRDTNNCCVPGQKCGSNLLCANGVKLTREWCDNKEWRGCSKLGPDVLEYGVDLSECTSNLVCYNGSDCCTSGATRYYIDPTNGNVQDARTATIDPNPPTWWDIGSTSTGSLSVSSSPTASQSPSSSSQPGTVHTVPSSSLSIGARAGIGVGCTIGAIGLGALVWVLLRRRRRPASKTGFKAEQGMGNNDDKAAAQTGVYQLHGEELPRQELDPQSRRMQEMPS